LAKIERLAAQLPLVEEFGVFFLQGSRIGQHGAAQVSGRRTGVYWTAKAVFHQQWKVAAVIDVGMRKQDSRYFFRRERKALV
jgi:hypothetical protein